MQRRSVVLPLPERPMIITASRWRTSRSTPRSTWLSPKYFSMPRLDDHLAGAMGRVAGVAVIGRRAPSAAPAAAGSS